MKKITVSLKETPFSSSNKMTPNTNAVIDSAAVIKKQQLDTTSNENEPADFEKAMDTVGYGWFNIFLYIIAIPATCATVFETTTMSYILPVAECDLGLTLRSKGVLNAVTYGGMICSAMVWGYLADTKGRRKVLVYGFIADAICVFGSSMSQNMTMLIVFKFFGGFICNGPGTVIFTYYSELHGVKQRARVLMLLGVITTLATLMLPMLALAIFPHKWHFTLMENFTLHQWHLFLLISGLPSLICGLSFTLLPESPKFLMSHGRNAEALEAFRKMYALNTRKPKNSFPITQLIEEVPNRESNTNEMIFTIENTLCNEKTNKSKTHIRQHHTLSESLRNGKEQIKPMFQKPLLGLSLLVYTMQFCILLGLNTIRLWLPQLFASIAQYEKSTDNLDGSTNLCEILEYNVNMTSEDSLINFHEKCSKPIEVSYDMYSNNIYVSLVGIFAYFCAGSIVKMLGQKLLMTIGLTISGCLGLSLYWSVSGLSTLIISALFIAVTSISTSSLLGVIVGMFPTTLRTLIVATCMMFGRLGALSGNMLFPILVEIGCLPPFLMVSSILLLAGALSFLLPDPKKNAFK